MTLTADAYNAPRLDRADRLRFDFQELSGSLGDLGTFLPLAVAMALTCGMDVSIIFLGAGLMNVATGWIFRQPIPVQPMKAIAAVAIAEGLTAGQIAAAGMLMGAMVSALAIVGSADWIAHRIPGPIVRGIQAGVGLELAWKGLRWLHALPAIGSDSWTVAVVVAGAAIVCTNRRVPVLLIAFLGGFLLLGFTHPEAYVAHDFAWPRLAFVWPTADQWGTGLVRGAVPQLPLTLLNSVVAVCALSADYFPGRGIPPRRMAASVGLMNLVCVPFGAMPMCHGSGGLAAHYRFGARTGGSVIMLGAMKIVAGLLLGSVLLAALKDYPRSILAVMLVLAGVTLVSAARDSISRARPLALVVVTAGGILAWNTLYGFLAGAVAAAILAAWERRGQEAQAL